jgi:hypothetical protein
MADDGSGELSGTGLGGVCAWVFGVVRTGTLRGVERRTRPSQTTTTLAGRCNAAEDRVRARGELAYGDEHGEQRAREDGGELTVIRSRLSEREEGPEQANPTTTTTGIRGWGRGGTGEGKLPDEWRRCGSR